ncbi:hypothetical protein PSTG_14195 [Puccinia striiformis f. sp. tritici PST-78]|uniref:Uncharacterized protein n=1 Tax=Puccinia striiformis f. sp. tritici PST-78 TaxID=1165861 RepID=A0A0L0UZE5_9BASI|nr:hypothetical protein PSTG_14195 [Puccinia striiformis f. sp. tritici PST-78]
MQINPSHALQKFGDLPTLFNSLTLAVNAQIMSVHESIGKGTMKKLVNVPKVSIPLLGNISTIAIKECKAHFNRLKNNFNPTKPCSHTLTTGVGIPCAHRIAELLESGDGLEPEDSVASGVPSRVIGKAHFVRPVL